MLGEKKIGFLGGGKMAEAMIKGLIRSKISRPDRILVSDIRKDRLKELSRKYRILMAEDNKRLVRESDIVILAIKPQVIFEIIEEIKSVVNKDKLFISIVAGVRTTSIQKGFGKKIRLIRTMPNTPAIVQAGITAIAKPQSCDEGVFGLATELFSSIGEIVIVNEELLDAVTGLSGSGPAYIFLIIEALSDAGVKMGLSRDVATLLAAQTIFGSAKLLLETKEHPGKLKDMVTSPGGTTIAGIHVLEKSNVRAAIIDAVEAATRRSKELGK